MIVLGYGTFAIGATDIAVTRGGGTFKVIKTNKEIIADGDYGPVEGRIRVDGSRCELMMNTLEVISANLTKFYPATALDTTTVAGTATLTGTLDIIAADYNATVTWTGVTDDGKAVIIEVENAINLGDLDWSMVDKDEIVPQITYTGTYDAAARTTEPWSIDFVDA